MNLRVLNEIKPNVLQYLPYGVTTVEIRIEGDLDELLGHIYPIKVADREKKLFVGFADTSEDFLVLWGAGSELGLKITNENVKGKLYFQIMHIGNSLDTQSVTLCHSQSKKPIATLKLVPANNSPNVIKMEQSSSEENETKVISFNGSKIPLY